MEPIPETVEALEELTRQGDTDFARTLLHLSQASREVVPEIVGMSLSFVQEELTFTMTATAWPVAELDAMQYLDGGPCERTLRTGDPSVYRADDPDDEERWQLFAQATAAAGVASTLSLPFLRNGVVVAGINLYASTSDAFAGRQEEIAAACGAWAGGAIANADLDFTTRFRAAEAADRIRTQALVGQAIGVLLSRSRLDPAEAEDRLRDAARRAGISDGQMARAILDLLVSPSSEQ